jgi:hypothetical protein
LRLIAAILPEIVTIIPIIEDRSFLPCHDYTPPDLKYKKQIMQIKIRMGGSHK